jgi:hypothetical protein
LQQLPRNEFSSHTLTLSSGDNMKLLRYAIGGFSAITLITTGLTSCSSDQQAIEVSSSVVNTDDSLSDTEGVTPIPQDQLGTALDSIAPASSLSTAEIESLQWMREEEKLAGDTYTTLATLWGSKVFTNISAAEFTHTSAVGTLLDRYQIEDPTTDQTVGVFTNPIFTQLYADLVQQGSKSLLDAMIVGAIIEDLDIKDLQDRATPTADIKLVYDNLELGSRNHLRAFTKQIAKLGGSYTPTYISQSEYDAIISGANETGFSG